MVFLQGKCGYSQDLSFQAEVNSDTVALGSSLQLTLTINGTQKVSPIQLPELDGFDVQYLGPSRRVSIVNGQTTSSIAFSYSLFPLEVGQFRIPALQIIISGQTLTTQPIDINVVDSPGGLLGQDYRENIGLKDKIFLVMKVAKNTVYVNERLPVKILLFLSDIAVRDVQYPEISGLGFSMQPIIDHRKSQQVINGRRFDIVEFDTFIFPTRTGKLKLGPAQLQCNLLVQNPRRFSGRLGSIFDDDFFDSFFSRTEKRQITLKSQEVIITVKNVPTENQPADFSGAVGNFDFETTVSPDEVNVGDPLTLRMTITGDGNLNAIQFPALSESDKLKLYEPQIHEEVNSKILEQVVIPKTKDLTEITVIEFSYFSPAFDTYKIIARGPFPIKVNQAAEDGLKIIGLDQSDQILEKEIIGKDIVYIKDHPGKVQTIGYRLYQSIAYYVVLLIGLTGFLGGCGFYKRTHRLETDISYARKLLAPKEASKGIKAARNFLAAQNESVFYDTLFKTLQNYLGNKFHVSSPTVTFDSMKPHLQKWIDDQKMLDNIRLIFDECDQVRYASAQLSEKNMLASLQGVEHLIDYLERKMK